MLWAGSGVLRYVRTAGYGYFVVHGELNLKAFSYSQLQRFFHAIDSGKFRMLFSYQAQLGLRIGEAESQHQLHRPRNEGIDLEDREGPGNETVAFISKHTDY
jgi:hypothetical protein